MSENNVKEEKKPFFNFNTPEVTVEIQLRKNNKTTIIFSKNGQRLNLKTLNPDEKKLLKKQAYIALAQATKSLDDIL